MTVQVSHSFSATGASGSVPAPVNKSMNLSISWNGAVGTVQVQRQLPGDSTSTWRPVKQYTNTDGEIEAEINEDEENVVYRFQCTSWTSGTINCRYGF